MIPRLHKRGKSFKGACGYILHDPGRKTADRVDWTMTQNLGSRAEDAWFEMTETCRDQDKLKAAAGVDARGRKNTNPVLHYTLSWHADDKPTREQMEKATVESLKALGLSEHEALVAAHRDKEHMHVHVVVNTVHPVTGRTAPLKFTKDKLRDWALAYEKENGIRCEERVKNDEKRRLIAKERSQEGLEMLVAASLGEQPKARTPYVPVKDESPHRRHWFERKDIIDRIKRLAAQAEIQHKIDRNATWTRQRQERKALDADTRAAVDNAREHVGKKFKPKWRDLYQAQKQEMRFVKSRACHTLERAVVVFQNRDRIGGKRLTVRRMASLILSGTRLARVLEQVHARERRALAREHKTEAKRLTDVIEKRHTERFDALRQRQKVERGAERTDQHRETSQTATFARAKAELIREEENPSLRRPDPPLTRAEEIERDMEQWRKTNPDRDFGREM